MSTVGVECVDTRRAKNTDYDAAQALLDLQSNKRKNVNTCTGWRDMDSKDDIEKAAKLILSCFITSDVPVTPNLGSTSTQFPVTSNVSLTDTESYRDRVIEAQKICNKSHRRNIHKRSSFNRKSSFHNDRDSSRAERNRSFCDAGTQTEEQYLNPKILIMETTIKSLCDRIKSLEAQLKTSFDDMSFERVDRNLDYSDDNNDEDPDFEMTTNDTDTANDSKYSRTSDLDSSAFNSSHIIQTNKNVMYSGVLTPNNKKSQDLIPIGDGNASVPSRLLKQINWNSYSSATRKLLTAVFSRRILATHSLTGKPSPAFPNKPAKKRLDPSLVNDIVQTVVERCHVPENVVRTSITTKCADESKMFRTREKNKKKRSNKNNRENISPSSDSESDDY